MSDTAKQKTNVAPVILAAGAWSQTQIDDAAALLREIWLAAEGIEALSTTLMKSTVDGAQPMSPVEVGHAYSGLLALSRAIGEKVEKAGGRLNLDPCKLSPHCSRSSARCRIHSKTSDLKKPRR